MVLSPLRKCHERWVSGATVAARHSHNSYAVHLFRQSWSSARRQIPTAVATAASYGVDAHEAHTVDEVTELVKAGIADRQRLTLINARTIPVGV
jgi:hypothetical protein